MAEPVQPSAVPVAAPVSSPTPQPSAPASTTPVVAAPSATPAATPQPSDKAYKELQSWATKVNQSQIETNKKMEAFHKILTDALKPAHDPERFIEELKAGGPEFLVKALKAQFEDRDRQMMERLTPMQQQLAATESMNHILLRASDPENYPDFKTLVPEMMKLLDSENLPINPNLPTGEYMDALYKLVRASKSEAAVAAAHAAGRTEMDTKLKAEAAAVMPGGGTHVPTPNKPLSSDEMLEILRKQGKVVE